MSINAYNGSTQQSTTLANGMRIALYTKSAYETAKQNGTVGNNILVGIVDDFPDDIYYADKDVSNAITVNSGTLNYAYLSRNDHVYNLNLAISNVTASGSSGTLVATIDTTKIPWITQSRNKPFTLGAVNDNIVIATIVPSGKITIFSQGSSSVTGQFLFDFTYIVN